MVHSELQLPMLGRHNFNLAWGSFYIIIHSVEESTPLKKDLRQRTYKLEIKIKILIEDFKKPSNKFAPNE